MNSDRWCKKHDCFAFQCGCKDSRAFENITSIDCPIKPWGMGVTTDEKGEYVCYGYPGTTDPKRFHPDPEVCTQDEIKNHLYALHGK